MLRKIPPILSPELLKILCEMGHSDRLVIADGNFPAESMGKNAHVIRMDGHDVCRVLDAILELFPLDTYIDQPVTLMEKVPGDTVEVPIWTEIENIIKKHQYSKEIIGHIDRFQFYEEAKVSYVIIATSEKALYGNVLLQKGVL